MRSVLIYLIFLSSGLHQVLAQTFNSNVLECFESLFVTKNFDSIYYTHKDAKPRGFFVIREGSSDELRDGFPEGKNLFELKNGNWISINSKGLMFVWGIKYYIKFKKNTIDDNECLFTFEGIEFNGFTEKVLEQREMKFTKEKDHWREVFNRKL